MEPNRFLASVEDPSLRKVAEEHPDCLHPCVWLVKDEDGPLEAGGKPRLPVGQEWPRAEGKPLAYLLSIDTSMLPEWSPLPRNSGALLLFVGHSTCEIVMVAPGVETHETEPPLEEYESGLPIAGDVLESTRFRLEEGLHAGMSGSWSPTDHQTPELDGDLLDDLMGLNGALEPEGYFGRLFGFHECWMADDPARITKYSYLERNGFPEGWYEDLDGSVKKLQRKLEYAKSQKPMSIEPMPMIAESLVRACEKWVAAIESKVADRQELTDADERKKIEDARTTLARRQKRWQLVKAGDPQVANLALEQLMDCVRDIEHEMDRMPNSKVKDRAAFSELLKAAEPMHYACRSSNCDVIQKTWNDYEAKFSECASRLTASDLATALHWRLQGYQDLMAWSRQQWIDSKTIGEKIEAVQWWQADVPKHEAQLAHWRPLLVMDAGGGPYPWGDAGCAIILADERDVAQAKLGRFAIAVDVS